jgi:hypothetical protein
MNSQRLTKQPTDSYKTRNMPCSTPLALICNTLQLPTA